MLRIHDTESGIIEDARHLRRERGRVRAALMTDEQREEINRKRREAYKMKKSHAQNKENDPGLNLFGLMIKVFVPILYCASLYYNLLIHLMWL